MLLAENVIAVLVQAEYPRNSFTTWFPFARDSNGREDLNTIEGLVWHSWHPRDGLVELCVSHGGDACYWVWGGDWVSLDSDVKLGNGISDFFCHEFIKSNDPQEFMEYVKECEDYVGGLCCEVPKTKAA